MKDHNVIPKIYISEYKNYFGTELVNSIRGLENSLNVLPGKLNGKELEVAIEEDKSNNFLPLIVFAYFDGNHIDDIIHIKDICTKHNIWLHIEGDLLPLLIGSENIIMNSKTTISDDIHLKELISSIRKADSLLFNNSTLFSSISEMYWLHLHSNNTIVQKWLKNGVFREDKLVSLSTWLHIHSKSPEYFEKSMNRSLQLVKSIDSKLKLIKNIEIYNNHCNPCAVIFRYIPNIPSNTQDQLSLLLNNLNQQIYLDLCSNPDASKLGLGMIGIAYKSESDGVESEVNNYIAFHPLLSNNCKVLEITEETISKFLEIIQLETTLIESTIQCRESFNEIVSKSEGLSVVHVDNFIGLGAVRYVPPYLSANLDAFASSGDSDGLTMDIIKEIDSINYTLASNLSGDPLFGISSTPDGKICVTMGVDTKPITPEAVEGYITKLHKIAKQIELSSKILEKISQMIQRGIKQAEQELIKEEYDQSVGVIRYIPVVSSVWNWISPLDTSQPKHHGRSFNLASPTPVLTNSNQPINTGNVTPRSSVDKVRN